ncbi:MAG: efflux RND transporter permease subunit [Gloeotrichia echinulata IR180]
MKDLFYRNSKLLILTLTLIVVWGLSSFELIPRMEDPPTINRTADITTFLPGASPYRVESLITEKIEQSLSSIKEIDTIDSTSELGQSRVGISLKDEITDTDPVWSRIRDRIADIIPQLPPEAQRPIYEEGDSQAFSLLTALTWELDTPPNYSILRRIGLELFDDFENLWGTDKVELVGVPAEEIMVTIDPDKLSALGLTVAEVSQQIQTSDAKVAAGQLRSNRNDLLLEVDTSLKSLSRIREIPIRYSNGGQFTRLGDIALVTKGIEDPPPELTIIDGKPAIVIAVMMESGQRIDEWTAAAEKIIDRFRQGLPNGVSLNIIFEQNRYVVARLEGLFANMWLGVGCVMLTAFVMMGWRAAIVMGTSLPLSILMVFGGMNFFQIPLHQMSVTGIVIALGILIDNSIVVVDEIQKGLQEGISAKIVIPQTVKYLGIPLMASTLTTILSFMPIALLEGGTGEFVRSIAQSVMLALVSSLFLALTIIPVLSVRLHELSRPKNHLLSAWWNAGISFPALTWLYRRILSGILFVPILGIILGLLLPLAGFVVAADLPEQFFPPAERDQLTIEIQLSSTTALEVTTEKVKQAQKTLLNNPEVKAVQWFLGRNAPPFYYNLSDGIRDTSNFAQGLIQLNSATENPKFIQSLESQLKQILPMARVSVRLLEQGPPVSAPIELRIYGSDVNILREVGEELRTELAKLPDISYSVADLSEIEPKLGLKINEETARLTGLDNAMIANQLNTLLEGSVGGSILESTEELPVRVRVSNSNRSNLQQIASLDLLGGESQSGRPNIPVSSLVDFQLIPELAVIPRRNGKRVNTVQGFIQPDSLASTVLDEFRANLDSGDFRLPLGYTLEFGGEEEERNSALAGLVASVGVLTILLISTLVLSFNSFRFAALITFVGISSIGLALLSLWLSKYPLGFMSIVGTIGLVGLAMNDSILILAALEDLPLDSRNNRQEIREVIVTSTRHVLTTTLTTVTGFMPLFLYGGSFWGPLAICISGGVLGATFLALIFIPSVWFYPRISYKLNWGLLDLLQKSLRGCFKSGKG